MQAIMNDSCVGNVQNQQGRNTWQDLDVLDEGCIQADKALAESLISIAITSL